MSKTEQHIREQLAQKGFVIVMGKRAFDIAKKLEASKAIPGARFKYDVYNGNGVEFRSQWNSPRSFTVYETAIYSADYK